MKFEEIKEKLKDKIVGIAGAGGLGSNCAASLVRCGVGTIIIADFDTINETNLNRQYFFFEQIGEKKVEAIKVNLLKINPYVNVITIDKKLEADDITEVFSKCDVIVEAFDNAEMKKMIIETVLNKMSDKPLIVGSGLAGYGNTSEIKLQKYENLYIYGDGTNDVSEENPPLAPKVNIVANMQADVVLSILLNKKNENNT